VSHGTRYLGMLLKGFPRISESFISTEILLLESLGIPIQIYSLREPRENFSHRYVQRIKAPVTYMPEYVLPHWRAMLETNAMLWRRLGSHYADCLKRAVWRACERKNTAVLRHFFQAAHLCTVSLIDRPVVHLHAHFCHTPASVAFFAAELIGLPFSFTAHAKDIYTSEPSQIARKMEKARFVVTCTRSNAMYLSRIAEDAHIATPIHTIYHGIDIDFFSFEPAPPAAPPYRILSVGRMVPKKGYDDLLTALKLLDQRGLDFMFTHIGSGEMGEQIAGMVRDLGLGHRVRLLGTLSHDAVISHFRKSHCFALACKVASNGDRDGIPNVLVEAMAVGIPVVATNVSAIPELVENGVTGLLVESQDPRAMAEALYDTLVHPGKYRVNVERARTRVEKDFNNRRCVMALYSLFRDVMNAP
jgi:glycosyltransferase involved in cell wall biosynthesis